MVKFHVIWHDWDQKQTSMHACTCAYPQEAQIFLCFALWTSHFRETRLLKIRNGPMISGWSWTHNNGQLSYCTPTTNPWGLNFGPFCSINSHFWHIFVNWKCTEWPKANNKVPCLTLSTCPQGPNCGQFHSMTSCLQNLTHFTIAHSKCPKQDKNAPNWNFTILSTSLVETLPRSRSMHEFLGRNQFCTFRGDVVWKFPPP